jgi:hypothetical protein
MILEVGKMKIKILLIAFLLFQLVFANYSFMVSSLNLSDDNETKFLVSRDGDIDYWAVIINVGINPHQYVQCRRDQKDLNNVLIRHGWKKDNIRLLLEEEATKDAIIDAFHWLYVNVDEDDVVFFFSGTHGYYLEDQAPYDEPDGFDEFIQPFDYDWETDDNCITDDELKLLFANVKSKNIAIIIESCHSGGMIDGENDLCDSGRVVITACDVDESGCPILIRLRWCFAFFYTNGLQGRGDLNKDKWVSAEEAFDYSEELVIFRSNLFYRLLYKIDKAQHPQIYDGWPTEENNEDDLKLISL